MAIHRKVHLFDIDIPGKITFKASCLSECTLTHTFSSIPQESETLTGGTTINYFDTGMLLYPDYTSCSCHVDRVCPHRIGHLL